MLGIDEPGQCYQEQLLASTIFLLECSLLLGSLLVLELDGFQMLLGLGFDLALEVVRMILQTGLCFVHRSRLDSLERSPP